ncbi:MAG: hypothetical protein A2V98_19070 [Planctomycetes bacterium RBG_16_64_12]|nr:MAG: hypothetical protein A2V98_19070 [Planctomycetes bacterium RBG_16_64_12]
MIARWLKTAMALVACFCVATLLAQGIIVGSLWMRWQLDGEKILQMLAIAQGVDLFAAEREALDDREEVPPEEPSYQDWIERRATMFRDLELRDLAMENALAQLSVEQGQLAEDRKALRQVQEAFEAQLAASKQEAQTEGMQTLGGILESLKPKQAKEQIIQMLASEEIDKVVILLSAMTESKRAKILAEFKTPEEVEKVGEILRRITEGEPVSSVADAGAAQAENANLAGSN